jgi:hypothetical protein
VLSNDHLKLLRNAVMWATNEDAPVVVTGPGMIDLTVWRQKGSMTIHLVNLTNPMTMKGPVREVIPLPGQRVKLNVPKGMRSTRVRLLVSGADPRVRTAGDQLEIELPPIGLHEVVAIDLTRA